MEPHERDDARAALISKTLSEVMGKQEDDR
jgi:hypothetical protein